MIVGKRQIHDDGMAERFKPCRIVVRDYEILPVLVVFLIFKLELHAENAFLHLALTTVCNI